MVNEVIGLFWKEFILDIGYTPYYFFIFTIGIKRVKLILWSTLSKSIFSVSVLLLRKLLSIKKFGVYSSQMIL